MALSFKSNFYVYFRQENEDPYHIIESCDKKFYLCAAKGESFYIKIKQNFPTKTRGVRLFLDGDEVNSIKTIKYECHYYGFKLGGGNYKKFLFDIPETEETNFKKKRKNHKVGTIHIEFFETERIKSKRKQKADYKGYKTFCKSSINPGTKFFERPLAIKEGNDFTVKEWDRDSDNSYEYIVDYTKKIDEIIVYYTDFMSLQIKGVVRFFFN